MNVAQWVADTAAAAAGGAEQLGTAANPITVETPNESQLLILSQKKQLEEMKKELAAKEAALRQQFDIAVKEAAEAAKTQQQEMRRVQEELMSEWQQSQALRSQMAEQRRQQEQQ